MQLAGSVTAHKHQRAATSDWMELERQRGISVSSTVMQFDYGGYSINLLDTPGHNDFSEDTYRVLMAVDAVVMVIDAGKGIESQTQKLFEVCRLRRIPIFTFMNKCDRPTREPLDLVDEIEQKLQLRTFVMNWPAGAAREFRGVYDRLKREVHFFERVAGGAFRAPVSVHDLSHLGVKDALDEGAHLKLRSELDLLDQAGEAFDPQAVGEGDQTPIFFGSASNNFGIQLLLDSFLEHAPPPGPRQAEGGIIVDPAHPAFSGFIFKIQSNMDPKHRDQIVFLRVCSGSFRRNMQVYHSRSGKTVRLSSSHKIFGRERESVQTACPGDVIGLVGHAGFGIGDTLTEDPGIVYPEIPRFAPEHFAYLHVASPSQYKHFRAGLDDLPKEGLVQVFLLKDAAKRVPLLGVVGPLQFDVLRYRLKAEYGADSRLGPAPWKAIRWVAPQAVPTLGDVENASGVQAARDEHDQPALLFRDEWLLGYFGRNNPQVQLTRLPPGMGARFPPASKSDERSGLRKE